MNNVILIGRITKDPVMRIAKNDNGDISIVNFTIAVDRIKRKNDEQSKADFIRCVAFARKAEFIQKYLKQGSKIAIQGRIQTGIYKKDDRTVFTTDVLVENIEFAESRKADAENSQNVDDMYSDIPAPDDTQEELPFK